MINNSLSKSVREKHGYTMKAEWNSCAPQLPWGQVLQPTTTEIYFKLLCQSSFYNCKKPLTH